MTKNIKNRNQFTFYSSFYEAIKNLDNKEQQADFYNAICEYSLCGNEPEFKGMLRMAWELIKPNLESGRKKAICRLKKQDIKTNEEDIKTKREDIKTNCKDIKTSGEEEKEKEEEIEKEIEKEKEKEIEKEIYKEKNIKKEIFKKPTIEEVKNYCLERKNQIDPESFVAFYNSKGWKVGNQPMKNWQAAVITWERKSKAITPIVNTDKKDEFYL